MNNESRGGAKRPELVALALCAALAFAVLFIHGYHPYSEDGGIYVPAIKKFIDPSLYPYGADFFEKPAHLSIFAPFIAESSGTSHLPVPYALLFWYLVTSTILLYACFRICRTCFQEKGAAVTGTVLIASVISMPVAGTSLLLSDPYLTSRSFSTPAILLAIAVLLEHRTRHSFLWLGIAALFHPLMAAWGVAFILTLLAVRHRQLRFPILASAGAVVVLIATLTRIRNFDIAASYREAVMSRTYFFLSQWKWFEIAGAVAPLVLFVLLLIVLVRMDPAKLHTNTAELSLAVVIFGSAFLVFAAAATWMSSLFIFVRLQPMRAFHLIYFLFLLIPVNIALRALLKTRVVAYALFFMALAAGMHTVQRQTYPSSAHIEWPWRETDNQWQQAFAWVRENTPKEAVFALSPEYNNEFGEDHSGFRAMAERSALADRIKDGGVVALFPEISETWLLDVNASGVVNQLQNAADATPLLSRGAQWVIVRAHSTNGLDCLYRNTAVEVCRLGPTPDAQVASTRVRALPKHTGALRPD